MAKITIPFLVEKKNRDGSSRFYWQPDRAGKEAGWQSVALGKDPVAAQRAAQDRNREYEQWKLTGEASPLSAEQIRRRRQAGTLGALIEKYRREILQGERPDGSPRIGARTARTYETSLKRLEAWAGRQPLAYITRQRVKVLRGAMLETLGHHAAFATLKMGRVLFRFAEDEDMVEPGRNPFLNFGLAAPDPRDVIWSAPARELMVETADAEGFPSIALAIMLGFSIGQREQDILALTVAKYVPIPEHKMQPEDFATLAAMAPDGVPRGIRVRQLKTKAWIEVPVVGEPRRRLEANIARARAAGHLMIVLDDTRSPRAQVGEADSAENIQRAGIYAGEAGQTRFQRDFAEIRELAAASAERRQDHDLAAEIRTLQFRDLRRTCVVYLGELGLDVHLIAAITGHDLDETMRILRTYMPRTTGRAARAIALAAAREAKEAEAAEREKGA